MDPVANVQPVNTIPHVKCFTCYKISVFHHEENEGSRSCGKEDDCISCLFKIDEPTTSGVKASSVFFSPKLIQFSLNLHHHCCNKEVSMPDINNWL